MFIHYTKNSNFFFSFMFASFAFCILYVYLEGKNFKTDAEINKKKKKTVRTRDCRVVERNERTNRS